MTRNEVCSLGADDYVSKPIRPEIVRARIGAHLRLAMQRRQLAALSMQSEERFSRAFQLAPVPMVMATLSNDVRRFVRANDSFCSTTGHTE